MIDDRKLQDAIAFIYDEISYLEDELDNEEIFSTRCKLDNMKNALECLYSIKREDATND